MSLSGLREARLAQSIVRSGAERVAARLVRSQTDDPCLGPTDTEKVLIVIVPFILRCVCLNRNGARESSRSSPSPAKHDPSQTTNES
jgi:hypothetical protein